MRAAESREPRASNDPDLEVEDLQTVLALDGAEDVPQHVVEGAGCQPHDGDPQGRPLPEVLVLHLGDVNDRDTACPDIGGGQQDPKCRNRPGGDTWPSWYDDFFQPGVYLCRRCDSPLYRSGDKFDAHCGWPAFDDEIPGAVTRKPDPDGFRTEIECARCGAHLGHVFPDGRLAGDTCPDADLRYCVLSSSLEFKPQTNAN